MTITADHIAAANQRLVDATIRQHHALKTYDMACGQWLLAQPASVLTGMKQRFDAELRKAVGSELRDELDSATLSLRIETLRWEALRLQVRLACASKGEE